MSFFNKFTIKNFRSFRCEQNLIFGIPAEDKLGSGITYIVGANNSGKTTIIEGLAIRKDKKIPSSERQTSGDPEFILYDQDNIIKRKACLVRPESYTIVENPELNEGEIFEIVSSRRHWDSNAQETAPISHYLLHSGTNYSRRNDQVRTASILKAIEKDTTKYQEFINIVQQVIPEFEKFAIGFEEHEYIEYISKEGIRHKSDFLGDGVISVIRILAHLFENSTKSLIIDEPELSLHPLAQKRLARLIAQYSKSRQIIISTHSPYFINWEYLRSGAKLNRIVKAEDRESKVYVLKDTSKYESLIEGANWQQPYLMDVVAKEIFFQDNILFLEGQEDVGLLGGYLNSDNVNMFGYGVRGYNNFEFALELARDMGIQKACVLLDSPTVTSATSEKNENAIKGNLERKFISCGYKIIQWNKNDIRDKESYSVEEKEGYFSKEGKLKPDEKIDDFNVKLKEIKDYFG